MMNFIMTFNSGCLCVFLSGNSGETDLSLCCKNLCKFIVPKPCPGRYTWAMHAAYSSSPFIDCRQQRQPAMTTDNLIQVFGFGSFNSVVRNAEEREDEGMLTCLSHSLNQITSWACLKMCINILR